MKRLLLLALTLGLIVEARAQVRTVGVNGSGVLTAPSNFKGTNFQENCTLYFDPVNGGTGQRGTINSYSQLSNAVNAIESGDVLILRPGFSTLLTRGGQRTNAPLNLVNKTNVTILGYGCTLQMDGIGTMWNIRNCSNIIMRGMTMIGVMTNNTLAEQSGAVWFSGNISEFHAQDVTMIKWPNHGFVHDYDNGTYIRNHSYVNCTFDTIGSTNGVGALPNDGTGITALTKNTLVQRCTFRNCLRGVESWQHVIDFDQEQSNVRIIDNLFDAIIDYGIFAISTNSPNWIITGNTFRAYPTNNTESTQIGILAYSGRNWTVANNNFLGLSGVLYGNASAERGFDGVVYANNTHSNISSHAIVLVITAGSSSLMNRWNFTDNLFYHIGADAIRATLDNSIIKFNKFIDTGVSTPSSAISSGFDGIRPGTNNFIIGNEFSNSGSTDYTDDSITIGAWMFNTVVRDNLIGPNVADIINNGTNTLGDFARVIRGSGSGSTNYAIPLSIHSKNEFYMGSSNVHFYAVTGGILGQPMTWSCIITNLSASTWGVNFSSGTNRWKFFDTSTGVTNSPSVLTNDTLLHLQGRSDGTNVLVRYNYYRPAL